MNSLNSVLLEGTVKDCESTGEKFTFLLEVIRYYSAGESEKETNLFRCEGLGIVPEMSAEDLNGKYIRIVGRAKMDWRDPRVIFVAEHVKLIP